MAVDSRSGRETALSASSAVEARFRAAWAAGVRPSIGEYLRDAENSQHVSLLLSLLEIDWRERVTRGESPQLEEYLTAFPEYACLLQELLIRPGESVDRWFSSTVSITPRDSTVEGEDLARGDRLGRYVLEQELGQGGFGVVWRANDPELGRLVAIKVLRPDRRGDLQRQESLLNEARKIARLNHDSILKVHDVLRDGDNICIVTELLKGGSLAEHVNTYAGRPWAAADIVRRVAEALHHAHVEGVVHRDVKPRNILLSADGAPRLADFGLATTEFEQLAEVRCALGTMAYMPPEVARGDCHYADPRSDIYSLGVVFYQLLTQRLPFVAKTTEQWLRQAIEREPRPLRTIDDQVPPELERMVLKCLAKDVKDRYTTARDLANEIAAAARAAVTTRNPGDAGPRLSEESSSSRHLSDVPVAASTAGRAWSPWLPTAVVVVALVCAGMLYVLGMGRSPGPDQKSEPRPLVSTPAIDAIPEAVAPESGPPVAELDGDMPSPDEWVSVLKQMPLPLLQSRRRNPVVLRHDAQEASLQVMDSGWSLLELGHTDAARLEMQVVFSQPGWEGGLGYFFGFHDSPELGPAVKRFQTVKVERATDRNKRQLQIYLSFVEVDELGSVRRRHDAPLGDAFAVPSRPLRLELRIAEQQVSVRLGPESAWVGNSQPLRWVEPADFQGKFGLFVNEASGTLSNVRVKFPRQLDDP